MFFFQRSFEFINLDKNYQQLPKPQLRTHFAHCAMLVRCSSSKRKHLQRLEKIYFDETLSIFSEGQFNGSKLQKLQYKQETLTSLWWFLLIFVTRFATQTHSRILDALIHSRSVDSHPFGRSSQTRAINQVGHADEISIKCLRPDDNESPYVGGYIHLDSILPRAVFDPHSGENETLHNLQNLLIYFI